MRALQMTTSDKLPLPKTRLLPFPSAPCWQLTRQRADFSILLVLFFLLFPISQVGRWDRRVSSQNRLQAAYKSHPAKARFVPPEIATEVMHHATRRPSESLPPIRRGADGTGRH